MLEQKIIASWLNTAQGCSDSKRTPYCTTMKKLENNKKVSVCKYITFEMIEELKANTSNEVICPYQGTRFKAFQRKGLKKFFSEPEGHYECNKGGE